MENFIASAHPTSPSEDFVIDGGKLTKYVGKGGVVVIPEGVAEIGDEAFGNCGNLLTAVIPDSVTSVGDRAFCGCASLHYASIGKGVQSIGERAFSDCRFSRINIPDSVTRIGERAFEGCSELVSAVIGSGVVSIGERALACPKLVEVINRSALPITADSDAFGGSVREVHRGVTVISNQNGFLFYTVKNKNYLLGDIAIDTDLVLPARFNGRRYELYRYAYYHHVCLTNAFITDSVTAIGRSAFEACSALTDVVIPDSVTRIDREAFEACVSLKSIAIPKSVRRVGPCAFLGCAELQSAAFSEGVECIGSAAFRYCGSLRTVVIPISVTRIGKNAFDCCARLREVRYAGSEEQWSRICIADGNAPLKSAAIHCARGRS